ncbi:TolC family protein [Herbaspirillum sp. C7C8]|uniref:TolC family protein n=1 Tax=Herbaspirillum sp. C7C8 TaxID=2736665 RepID=UPI001F525E63|nr:TolC family protein [Herbaspirillum sp. C7C8]MCI1004976.1 TolC family protein [Herbaspirillum sp. C7C8]
MSFRRISRALLALLAGMSGLAHAAPLSFNAALEIAERQSPNLASNRAQIAAAQSEAIPAGSLPDPKIFAGIDNYPISGPDRGRLNADSMTMQKIGVMQDFPNAAKRQARVAVAEASIETAEAQRQVERLKLRRATALAWLNRYFLERKISLFDDLDKENLLLADAVRAQIASGRTQVADSVMPKQEAAQLADRRDELIRDLVKAKSGLRRYVGGDADEPLVDALPELRIDADHLRDHLHKHPELEAFSAESHKTEAELRQAQAMKKSDWGVELAYQRRDPRFGNMVSVQFTFEIPVSPATRQDPLIAAKQQELYRIDADREAMLRDHTNELESDLADYQSLTRQLERANQTALPLAQQKTDLQYASYRAGKSDLTSVLAARREVVDQRLKIIDLEAQRSAVAAQLYFAYGGDQQ